MTDRFEIPSFELLPPYYRETDVYGYLQKICLALDDEFKTWNVLLDKLSQVWRVDKCDDNLVEILANSIGLPLPDSIPIERARQLVQELPRLYKRKGELGAIRDGIRIALNLSATVESLWNNFNYWTIGSSTIGEDNYIGPPYKSSSPDVFVLGNSAIGNGVIGNDAINEWVPRTIIINLNREPTEQELNAVRFIANLLKASEDHFEITYPSITEFWIVSQSRMGVDTMLAPGCWEIGVSLVGISSVICSPDIVPPPEYVVASPDPENITIIWSPTEGEVPAMVPVPIMLDG